MSSPSSSSSSSPSLSTAASSDTTPFRVLLIGRGRMGRLVETHAPAAGAQIVGILNRETTTIPSSTTGDGTITVAGVALTPERWPAVDVIIDFSLADAFLANLPQLVSLRANLVIGTTGWKDREPEVRRAIDEAGLGAVVAANFSVGANVLEAVAEVAGRLFDGHPSYGAWLHEAHHAAKKDAPSGTAIMLTQAVERGGFSRPIDVSSTRAGHVPGTHTVGFDGPSESITLSHLVRDRATFAHGALAAARWVRGRRGWFTMRDVLGIAERS